MYENVHKMEITKKNQIIFFTKKSNAYLVKW